MSEQRKEVIRAMTIDMALKRVIITASIAITLILLTGCNGKNTQAVETVSVTDSTSSIITDELSILRDQEFAFASAVISPKAFEDMGFEYGDSVDVSFSNGFSLTDIPYYNGFYVKVGEPLVCLYPGYEYPAIAYSGGPSLYDEAGLNENDTVRISLHERGKYISIQNSLSMAYSIDREDYSSDEAFANFRAMKGGDLKDEYIYRSASPCNNQYNRAPYASRLMENQDIRNILDLADKEEKTASYYSDASLDNAYWREVYEKDGVCELGMSASYYSDDFKSHLADMFRYIIEKDGPFLIHCTEGKDRTGFVCFVIEALAGASIEELENDYMLTYENYYNITKSSNESSYEAIKKVKFDDFIENICQVDDAKEVTEDQLYDGVVVYLTSAGLTETEIEQFKEKVMK